MVADIEIRRKLAALFAADVAGYSRLMSSDEEFTTRILSQYRDIMDGLIVRYGGRVANTAGDSVLAEFSSSVEAVRCAVEVQEALDQQNSKLPREKRLDFRIGIGVGDVIQRGDDLLGDGVNVAARLEAIAAPGAICISGDVRDQIEGKLTLQVFSLGAQRLKNIARPVHAFQIGSAGTATASYITFLKRRFSFSTLLGRVAILCVLFVVFLSGYWVLLLMKAPRSGEDLAAARLRLDRQALEIAAEANAGERDILTTKYFDGHRYALVRTWGGNWTEADAEARVLGGYLVAINSPAENDFVLDLIKDERTVWKRWKPNHFLGPWIGLVQSEGAQEPDGGWVWSNGEPVTYLNWYDHQPDNWNGVEGVARFHHWLDQPPPRWGDSPNAAFASGYIVEFDR